MSEKLSAIANRNSEIGNGSGPWFFSDPAAVVRLLASCESCRNTPWHFGSRAKGRTGGMDCTSFPEVVMCESGAAPEFKFKRRPRDMSRHVFNERIVNYFRGLDEDPQSAVLAERFAELDVRYKGSATPPSPSAFRLPPSAFSPLPGDICILKTSKGLYHLLVMMRGNAAMHCAAPDGVTEASIDAPNYRDHLVAAFRARALPSSLSGFRFPQSGFTQ